MPWFGPYEDYKKYQEDTRDMYKVLRKRFAKNWEIGQKENKKENKYNHTFIGPRIGVRTK